MLTYSKRGDHSGLLWESFEVNRDECNFLDITGSIKVVLEYDLRLLSVSKKQYIVEIFNFVWFLFDFKFKKLKLLLSKVFFSIEKPFYNGYGLKMSKIFNLVIRFLFIIIFGTDK